MVTGFQVMELYSTINEVAIALLHLEQCLKRLILIVINFALLTGCLVLQNINTVF